MDHNLVLHNYKDGTPIGVLNTPSLFNSTGHRLNPVSMYLLPTFNLNEEQYTKNAPIYISSLFTGSFYSKFSGICYKFFDYYICVYACGYMAWQRYRYKAL
jgi:hypothetical protein